MNVTEHPNVRRVLYQRFLTYNGSKSWSSRKRVRQVLRDVWLDEKTERDHLIRDVSTMKTGAIQRTQSYGQ